MTRSFGATLVLSLSFAGHSVVAQQPSDLLNNLPGAHIDVFRSDPYIRAAESIQALGKERGAATLLELAKTRGGSKAIVLCRMLFVAKPNAEFRRPALGAPVFIGGTKWPLEPIALIDGVPFFVVLGYALKGLPESPETYVRDCIENCDWNGYRFKAKTAQEKQKALEKLRQLDNDEKAKLSSQIK
jgi:hypothetical protein